MSARGESMAPDALGALLVDRDSLRLEQALRSATVAFIRERRRGRSVPVDHMTFEPYIALDALHAAYDAIDIALDPFPFNDS